MRLSGQASMHFGGADCCCDECWRATFAAIRNPRIVAVLDRARATARRRAGHDRGFLLVEVLVGVVLLSLLSAAVAGLLVVTLRAGTVAEERAIRVASATTAVSIVERSAPAVCTNEALVEGDGAARIAPEAAVVALEVVDGSPPVCLFSVEVDGLTLSGGARMVDP